MNDRVTIRFEELPKFTVAGNVRLLTLTLPFNTTDDKGGSTNSTVKELFAISVDVGFDSPTFCVKLTLKL